MISFGCKSSSSRCPKPTGHGVVMQVGFQQMLLPGTARYIAKRY